ncbi:MBL fold metallo-hydrolase [Halorubellus salinus]|uniref:MBL fold metallo-hydrolase n=1 Tax=Halorubellus salinus TaxID=755309 RepID=UPI001D06E16F|nr:MBL fold metallo-hydrolase [Halorubellus salinus]
MRCTLLGTGDVTGVPAPFRDLDDAGAAARRRRPGLLVETDAATLLFDVPPDFHEGVRDRGVRSLDATFVTHWHHDHVGGIDDLSLAARADVVADELYRTPTAAEHFHREKPYLDGRFDEHDLAHGDPVTVGDATVTPIPVRHDRPAFDTLAFRIETDDAAVVYAPDFRTWCPDMPGGDRYRDADLAILEATSVVAPHLLDDLAPHEDPVADAAAHRTVLVHLNEGLLARNTATIAADVADQGYELGTDFETFEV